jgi:hypothetical protein
MYLRSCKMAERHDKDEFVKEYVSVLAAGVSEFKI